MIDARRFAPATARNREPILRVLERFVPENASSLEIASGSGEHAVYLAPRLRVARWQPSDPDAESRASIDAWRAAVGEEGRAIQPAIAIDVLDGKTVVTEAHDLVVCINMIHISPWEACLGLLDLAAASLKPGGILFLYGPYRRLGAHTAPSNEAFDESLRARNPSWGVRDLEAVLAAAEARNFALLEVVPMPANNFSVVLSSRA